MTKFLDPQVITNFREVINSSPIFTHRKKLAEHWNLICAVMDRLEDSVVYLNKFGSTFKHPEYELINFFAFADTVVTAVQALLAKLDDTIYKKAIKGKEKEHWATTAESFIVQHDEKIGRITDDVAERIPADDVFYKYLRSILAAHPFETTKGDRADRTFLEDGEINYSPYVMKNSQVAVNAKSETHLGLAIYSNKFDMSLFFTFPFSALKNYINSRYVLLNYATEWAKKKISDAKSGWKSQKIDRSKSPTEQLKQIIDILERRYMPTHQEIEAIEYLNCDLTDKRNKDAVEKYRAYLVSTISCRCNEIENYENEYSYPTSFDVAMYPRLKIQGNGLDYYRQKVFNELNDGPRNDVVYGRMMAGVFAKDFAKNHVHIDAENMSFTEIKLLTNTAYYLENENQQKGIVSPEILKEVAADEKRKQELEEDRVFEKTGNFGGKKVNWYKHTKHPGITTMEIVDDTSDNQ